MSERPVHEDPYPTRFAMDAAVELEVNACLGRVQTQTIGKVIQRAINRALAHAELEAMADEASAQRKSAALGKEAESK